jgi:hypothetical protein
LDLSKTKISDGNHLNILTLAPLKDVYINETSTSIEVIEALKSNKPNLNIHLERGKSLSQLSCKITFNRDSQFLPQDFSLFG